MDDNVENQTPKHKQHEDSTTSTNPIVWFPSVVEDKKPKEAIKRVFAQGFGLLFTIQQYILLYLCKQLHFVLKKLPLASTLVLPLPVLTLLFNDYCRKCFLPIFNGYSTEGFNGAVMKMTVIHLERDYIILDDFMRT